MHHQKVPCFNPHCVFGLDGNAERPIDYERAASLVRICLMDGGAPELLEKLFGLLYTTSLQSLLRPWRLAMPLLLSSGGDNLCFARGLAKYEIRICPASLLNHVSQVHAPLIFTSTWPTTEAWLPRLHAVAVDATKRSRGLLGYFNFDQLNSIEGIFEDIGEPDPWPSTINS